MGCSCFPKRFCTAVTSVCVACEHAGWEHVAGAVVGEETGPAPVSTPCWQLLPHSNVSSTCPRASAQSVVHQLAIADSYSDARPSTGPRHRHLILPAVSRHDGDFCLCGERVPEEGSIGKRSGTRTPSVAMPASAAAVPWRAPALDCAGAGVCRAVQGAGKRCVFSPD